MEQDETRLLTIPQAARYLGVSRSSVYRWVNEARLPVLRVGPAGRLRVERQALDAWLGVDPAMDRSGVLSRSERVRLLAESDGSRRDVEGSPGRWVLSARPLTFAERTAYVN